MFIKITHNLLLFHLQCDSEGDDDKVSNRTQYHQLVLTNKQMYTENNDYVFANKQTIVKIRKEFIIHTERRNYFFKGKQKIERNKEMYGRGLLLLRLSLNPIDKKKKEIEIPFHLTWPFQ